MIKVEHFEDGIKLYQDDLVIELKRDECFALHSQLNAVFEGWAHEYFDATYGKLYGITRCRVRRDTVEGGVRRGDLVYLKGE